MNCITCGNNNEKKEKLCTAEIWSGFIIPYLCTRPKNHDGDHVACGNPDHHLASRPNTELEHYEVLALMLHAEHRAGYPILEYMEEKSLAMEVRTQIEMELQIFGEADPVDKNEFWYLRGPNYMSEIDYYEGEI